MEDVDLEIVEEKDKFFINLIDKNKQNVMTVPFKSGKLNITKEINNINWLAQRYGFKVKNVYEKK
jgi:hypothetical protein